MRSKKAFKNVVYSILQQFVTILCGLIVPRLIIKTYGSDINGILNSITQFLAYITLLESGMGPVVKSILYKPIAQKNKTEIEQILKETERFFHKIAYIFIGYIMILCFIFPLLYQKDYSFLFIASLVIIIAVSTFFEYFFGMTYKIYLQAQQETYIVSIIKTIGKIINTILFVLLILFGFSIHFVKLISALIFIMIPLVQNYYVKKKYHIMLKNIESSYKIENKWDGLSQHIAAIIHGNTDVAVLTFLSTPIEVSVYSVYMLVINSVKEFITSITNGLDATFGDMLARGEQENLNKKFQLYEVLYFTIITILFICTLLLIVPFVNVYTRGITDANYNRPLFAFILVLAEFIYVQRLPYNALTLSAGHFKQTKKGAWIEAIVNITLSIILVLKLGLVGIALGTFVAMILRTLEFIIYSSDVILKRKRIIALKKVIVSFMEVIIVFCISIFLPKFVSFNYVSWFLYAVFIFIIASFVVFLLNFIFYKTEMKEIIYFIKQKMNKKGEKS